LDLPGNKSHIIQNFKSSTVTEVFTSRTTHINNRLHYPISQVG